MGINISLYLLPLFSIQPRTLLAFSAFLRTHAKGAESKLPKILECFFHTAKNFWGFSLRESVLASGLSHCGDVGNREAFRSSAAVVPLDAAFICKASSCHCLLLFAHLYFTAFKQNPEERRSLTGNLFCRGSQQVHGAPSESHLEQERVDEQLREAAETLSTRTSPAQGRKL